MTEQTQPTDAPLNSIELMKVVMQADEETRAFALRGTTNWAAHIGKAVQNAVLAKWGTPAGAGEVVAWRVRMICCGKDAGFQLAKTWESADTFRNEYTSGAGVEPHGFSAPEHSGGHRRAAIIEGLYTTQQPTQAQAGAVPLTDEWVRSKCKEPWIFETAKQWVRMTEAAHGIKGADHA